MKKIALIISFVFTFSALNAQNKNTLLQADFWRQQPTLEVVKAEIEKGSSATAMDARSFDPTTLAINNNAPEATIKYLIDLPGNGVAKITHDSRIYLHWAAMRGNAAVVEYLLSKGADINAKDSRGTDPLVFALSGGQKNTAVYDAFVKAGQNIKQKYNGGANALLLGIANDPDLSLTNYLIGKGLSLKDTDDEGNTAFDYAARSGNIAFLKLLLEKGVKPTNGALIFASQGGRGTSTNLEAYKFLIEEVKLKPNFVNKSGENVLHSLVRKPNQQNIIEYFLGLGADVNQANEDGNTPFMLAASGTDVATLKRLAPKVKNINFANHKGETPITYAVGSSSPEILKFLIESGADVNVKDTKGNNLAYHLFQNYRPMAPNLAKVEAATNASQKDDLSQKMDLLITKGLDLSAPQGDGTTLYHIAVAKGNLNLLKRVADLKVDINAKNKEGLTPLHKAALIAKDGEILNYLLAVGANKKIKTEFDETAYDLASENTFLSNKKVDISFLK